MRLVHTTKNDKDFEMLTNMLEQEYFERFGEISLKYRQYNSIENILHAVVLYDEQKPIACGAYKYFSQDTVEIKRVFVTHEYRGQALSKQIMTALEDSAINEGFAYAVLQTGVGLKKALSLYRSIGYEVIPNFGDFEGDDICVCFKKKLELNYE